MIAKFFYSIAGTKQSENVDTMLNGISTCKFISQKDRNVAKYCLDCGEHGNYPSEDYFVNIYDKPKAILKTDAEIFMHYKSMMDFFLRQALTRRVTTGINETSSGQELISVLSKAINEIEAESDDEFNFDDCKPELYGDANPLENGLKMGIKELDDSTNGFQRGTVASICAYTGHGKSTAINSALYNHIMDGRKVLLLSIEIPTDMAWKQFETRYMFSKKNLGVDVQNMTNHTLSESVEKQVKSFEDDFKRDIVPNLLIIDESKITKKIMLDYRKISKMFRAAEKKLGGLDIVVIDHVGQLELQYPDCGNSILRQLTSAAKTYRNEKGEKIMMMWAVQCNREGVKRATRREGQYDLQAIADLNEVERSSSYCVFLYTSDAMKITQETKVSLLKARFGVPIPTPFVTSFTPSVVMVGQEFEKANPSDIDFGFTEMNDGFEDLPDF